MKEVQSLWRRQVLKFRNEKVAPSLAQFGGVQTKYIIHDCSFQTKVFSNFECEFGLIVSVLIKFRLRYGIKAVTLVSADIARTLRKVQ